MHFKFFKTSFILSHPQSTHSRGERFAEGKKVKCKEREEISAPAVPVCWPVSALQLAWSFELCSEPKKKSYQSECKSLGIGGNGLLQLQGSEESDYQYLLFRLSAQISNSFFSASPLHTVVS